MRPSVFMTRSAAAIFLVFLETSSDTAAGQTAGAEAREQEIRETVVHMAERYMNRENLDSFKYIVDEDEAYRWQDEFITAMKPTFGEVAGYKTGGHRPGPPSTNFPLHGIRGTLLEGLIHPTRTAIGIDDTVWGFLEADLAFRVGDTSINTARTDLEILGGLDAIVPFMEIPDPTYNKHSRSPTLSVVANMTSRYAFVGEPVRIEATEEWLRKINNFTYAVHDEHGTEIQRGAMAEWYKPVDVVRWLRDQLVSTGHELKPGQILSLGNIGIIRQLKNGSPNGGQAYPSDEFILSYYGLSADPATVVIRIER